MQKVVLSIFSIVRPYPNTDIKQYAAQTLPIQCKQYVPHLVYCRVQETRAGREHADEPAEEDLDTWSYTQVGLLVSVPVCASNRICLLLQFCEPCVLAQKALNA